MGFLSLIAVASSHTKYNESKTRHVHPKCFALSTMTDLYEYIAIVNNKKNNKRKKKKVECVALESLLYCSYELVYTAGNLPR